MPLRTPSMSPSEISAPPIPYPFAALKSAIPLSQSVIMSGSCVSVILNMMKTYANDRKRPLIEYDILAVLTPILLMGVSTGGSDFKTAAEVITRGV